jgi:hypothetical protein
MNTPIYCRDCHSANSWKRSPQGDWKSDTGKVLWEQFTCSLCGHTTIIPAKEVMKTQAENTILVNLTR